MNTNTRVYDCGLDRNQSLALLFAILPYFATIGSDTMWLLQDKIPVMIQSTQPKRWTQPQNQLSITNRHFIHDTVLREHLLHRISYAMTTFIPIISNLHSNTNEPYGRDEPHGHDDTSKANQDDSRLNSTNGPQVAASSSGGGGDDEEDPFNRKLHNNECGGDQSPTGRNANDQDDDQDHDNENGFIGEVVDVFGSDNPDDFPNVDFDDDMDIDEDVMVEVGVVDKEEDEDMVGLWQE